MTPVPLSHYHSQSLAGPSDAVRLDLGRDRGQDKVLAGHSGIIQRCNLNNRPAVHIMRSSLYDFGVFYSSLKLRNDPF
jgi:hypothetical protein